MLLAGDDEEQVGVLTVKNAMPGTSCTFGTMQNDASEITYDDFIKNEMIVVDGKATLNDVVLKAGSEEIIVEKVANGAKIR